ncbi:MAG: hypothetical protein ACJAWV_004362 [Flammeovirgaceae bacterium]|jgi:hypothetical protein
MFFVACILCFSCGEKRQIDSEERLELYLDSLVEANPTKLFQLGYNKMDDTSNYPQIVQLLDMEEILDEAKWKIYLLLYEKEFEQLSEGEHILNKPLAINIGYQSDTICFSGAFINPETMHYFYPKEDAPYISTCFIYSTNKFIGYGSPINNEIFSEELLNIETGITMKKRKENLIEFISKNKDSLQNRWLLERI